VAGQRAASAESRRSGGSGSVALEHLAQSKTAQIETQAMRVLFLNTRDSLGADVAVHLSLARWLDRAQTEV
jgi:hypothetical protein